MMEADSKQLRRIIPMKIFKKCFLFGILVILVSCTTISKNVTKKQSYQNNNIHYKNNNLNNITKKENEQIKQYQNFYEKNFDIVNVPVASEYSTKILLNTQNFKFNNNKNKYKKSINNFVRQNNQINFELNSNGIKLSVDNMPLNKFILLVFNKILNVNFFVDRNIKNRKDLITLKMEKPLSHDQFLDLVKSILARYNVTFIKKDNTFFIIPGLSNIAKIKINLFLVGRKIPADIPNNEKIMAIVPFYYTVPNNSYLSLIKRLALSNNAQISKIPNFNSIAIVDTAANIRASIKLISLFDRSFFGKRSIKLIKLDYIDVKQFVDKLEKLLPLEGIPVSSSLRRPGILLFPMDNLNSIVVVYSKKSWLKAVEFWKNRMDTIDALGKQPRFFIYYPKNRRASDLAKIFSALGGFSISASKKGKIINRKSYISLMNSKVIVDSGRNALIILATPQQYKEIKDVLERLDTLPKEVLIQVTIAEVTLTNKLQYGIEWYLKHSGKYNGIAQTLGGLGIGAAGLNYSIISDTQKFQALLNAFAKKDLINVISSPRLVVLDNHQASINVGTQVPTVTSEANSANIQTQGTTSLLRTIQYRKTGVILNIKPTINSGGILTLDINQQVSEPQINNTSKIDSPLILDRTIKTTVVLKSGTTLLLGGLIKNNKSTTISKVPILGDIPILGNLFKVTSRGSTKTELIIEITPYIISNIGEAETKTKEFESLLKWFRSEEDLIR